MIHGCSIYGERIYIICLILWFNIFLLVDVPLRDYVPPVCCSRLQSTLLNSTSDFTYGIYLFYYRIRIALFLNTHTLLFIKNCLYSSFFALQRLVRRKMFLWIKMNLLQTDYKILNDFHQYVQSGWTSKTLIWTVFYGTYHVYSYSIIVTFSPCQQGLVLQCSLKVRDSLEAVIHYCFFHQ